MNGPDTNDELEEDLPPSKSAIKREMTALQNLGEALCALSPRELAKIPIEDEDLLESIKETAKITSNSALRRHRQYIGKVMRRVDPEPIQRALDNLHASQRATSDDFHLLEALRDELLAQGDKHIGAVLTRFPGADRQQLRQLIRDAQREEKAEKPPKASRRLFRYLRELQELE